MVEKKKGEKKGYPVTFEGKKYASVNVLARSLKLQESSLSHLYNRIKNSDAAVEKCRSLQAKHPKLWGRIYSNLSELAASFGTVSYTHLKCFSRRAWETTTYNAAGHIKKVEKGFGKAQNVYGLSLIHIWLVLP